ncbi:alpha/beta hydrolase, partial [Pontibacter qinzhouensis]
MQTPLQRASQAILLLLLACSTTLAQQATPLYSGNIPNHIASETARQPMLTAYLPAKEKANGVAVIICPGGGYGSLVVKREGTDVAQALNEMGIAAFVLEYRLPSDATMPEKKIGPLQDAQQAIKRVRQQAAQLNIDPGKIGIMGFSAGGHLASTAGTHYQKSLIDNKENLSLRPDFMVLVYPVISFDDAIAHAGTKKNLLGASPTPDDVKLY